MLTALLLTLTGLADTQGFSLDAGTHGEVIDALDPDAGMEIPSTAITEKVTVKILGGEVQPHAFYLNALHLPAKAVPNEATANLIAAQLQARMIDMGYELASVTARVNDDDEVEVTVDEGKIDRILFMGQLSFQQLRFKLALALPYDVFNRDLLDRQVRSMGEQLGTPGVSWQLVRTAPVQHQGPQVEAFPDELDFSVAGGNMIHPRRPYEVRISFPPNEHSYVGVDLRAYYIDGIELGINYVGRDLLAKGDRWYVGGSGGVGARLRIGTSDLYPYFSRGSFDASYTTQKLAKYFRPGIWTSTFIASRQRSDLLIESFWNWTVDAALQLEIEVRPALRFSVAAGYEYRVLFGVESPPNVDTPYEGKMIQHNRPFVRLLTESVVKPNVLRWDRRHTLESEFRYYFPLRKDLGMGWVDLRYQYVKEFGWHDFWIKGHGHATWGDITFADEISVGEFVRGIFNGIWVPTAISILLEFRFSLVRDVLKVGAFADFGVFAERNRTTNELYPAFGMGVGPTVSLLALDMFQVDMFLGFGIRPSAAFNVGFGLILNKAF